MSLIAVRWLLAMGLLLLAVIWPKAPLHAETLPSPGAVDRRVRTAAYNAEEVYRLQGQVGFEIDLQFEPGETFVGLGAGDIEGVAFVAQSNHLFLKPKAANVGTNLTVLTSRRHYQFDYRAAATAQVPRPAEQMYAIRFTYPPEPVAASAELAARVKTGFAAAQANAPENSDYWYCGDPALKPVAAWDDGVHTWLRFGARAEQPAVFVRNADGSESLLNFTMDGGDVVVHRVARQFTVRRGRLAGCIANRGYNGSGTRLSSGTVAPMVERAKTGEQP